MGDAAFYSLHKSIAVSSGGILRVNNLNIQLPSPQEGDCCDRVWLEQYISTDMRAIANKRRENYKWLVSNLKHVGGMTIMYPDIGDLVPHDFPILVHDGYREKLYFELMKENFPTMALYYIID